MNLLNQFSFILIALGSVGTVYWLMRRFNIRLPFIIAVQALVLAVFITGFIVLRPGESDVDNIDAAIDTINNGRPTFVEFFSNYCTGCITLQPIVNNLVSDIQTDFDILRVDIHTQVGRDLRQIYDFSFTPEFVLFNDNGEEVWRDHLPPSGSELDMARQAG